MTAHTLSLKPNRYLTVDYERSNFSVHQCNFQENVPQNLVSIPSTNLSSTTNVGSSSKSSTPSVGADVGIAIGAFAIVLLAVGTWILLRRRRRRSLESRTQDVVEAQAPNIGQNFELETPDVPHELPLSTPLTPEVEGTELPRAHELYSPPEFTELPGGDAQVYELLGESRRLGRESNLSSQRRSSEIGKPNEQGGYF